LVPVGNKHHLFFPCPRNGCRVSLAIGQGPGNIRIGIQGIEEEQTAHDGFHIPPTRDPAGYLHPGSIGKGYKMKGISHTEEFFKETTGYIIKGFLI
jgi:hypothetical protein